MNASNIITVLIKEDRTFDYPENAPLPRVGDYVTYAIHITSTPIHGKVREVRHVFTAGFLNIKIYIK